MPRLWPLYGTPLGFMRHGLAAGWILAVGFLCAGCANYLAPFETEEAMPAPQTRAADRFADLPAPSEPVTAAVYRFRDQTGQYKPSDNISSWSTAVTQGSTSILMRALEASGWFDVIEREGLSNLMNERQIISSMRRMHEGESARPLPALRFAGVLLEGGVIGYDANIITGGAGARYFGAGASGEFRQDQVTIYLRAVSTQSGRVLKTVHVTKTIVSQKVDIGLFRFVEPERILEAEAGYTFNEPPVQAVTEAIEEAVLQLIVDGINDGIWNAEEGADLDTELFERYDRAHVQAQRLNAFNRLRTSPRRNGFGIGTGASALRYQGDYRRPLTRAGAEVYARGMLSPRWAVGGAVGYGMLAAEHAFGHHHMRAELHTLYYVLPHSRVSPYLSTGSGLLYQQQNDADAGLAFGDNAFPYAMAGAGIEWMPRAQFGVSAGARWHVAIVDGLDGQSLGGAHDGFWSARIGLTYYVGDF